MIKFPKFNKVDKYLVTERTNIPLLTGAEVMFNNKPACINEVNERTGWVYVTQDKHTYRVYPSNIGAKWLHS
jgi:hypothetical protein